MNPSLVSYMLNVSIMTGIFAVFAALELLLLGGVGWLLHHRWGDNLLRRLLPSMAVSIAIAVAVIPAFIGLAGLLRYKSPADFLFGQALLRADWEAYVSYARLAFLALYAALVILGGTIGFVRTRETKHATHAGIATSLAQLVYLLSTLGVADFFNVCLIGIPFLLPASC